MWTAAINVWSCTYCPLTSDAFCDPSLYEHVYGLLGPRPRRVVNRLVAQIVTVVQGDTVLDQDLEKMNMAAY